MASLMLFPANSDWRPDSLAALQNSLQAVGLAGDPLPEKYGAGFRTGPQFISQVSFLGCSPAIQLEPDASGTDDGFCAVRVHCFEDGAKLLSTAHNPRPRCPACHAVVSVDPALGAEQSVACAACGRSSTLYALDWRRAAGYARCFIEITGIYPEEALPTDGLLAALQTVSQCPWRYFYIQSLRNVSDVAIGVG